MYLDYSLFPVLPRQLKLRYCQGYILHYPMGVDISVFCIYIGVAPLDIWEVQESIDRSIEP